MGVLMWIVVVRLWRYVNLRKRVDMKKELMEVLGFDFVEVGYFGCEDETPWQTANELWMDEVGLSDVGAYFVNTDSGEWVDGSVDLLADWDWVHRIAAELGIEMLPVGITDAIGLCMERSGKKK